MTAKDWLVEINKWLRKNGYPTYDMRKMTKKQWGILSRLQQKITSISKLRPILMFLETTGVLEKVPLLSTYVIACVDGMMEKITNEEEEKRKKEKIQFEASENVKRWEKEKREHPEKFGIPENLLDRFK